jgi:hypothetical protein
VNLNPAICQQLTGLFGRFYPEASIETIDGVNMAVHFNGTDFQSLHPRDNDCNYAYIRAIDTAVRQVDLGGCNKSNYVKEFYRLIIVRKGNRAGSMTMLQQFVSVMSGAGLSRFTITGVDTDSSALYRIEAGVFKKNIKVKGFTYFAIDFSIESKLSTCDVPIC